MDAIKALHLEIKRLKEHNTQLKTDNRRLEWYKLKYEQREKTLDELQGRIYRFEVAEVERKGKKTLTIPFLAVGSGELEGQPDIKKGDMFDCPHCPDKHPLECGKNQKGEEDDFLLFYKCPKTGNAYLAGMKGKLIPFNRRGDN